MSGEKRKIWPLRVPTNYRTRQQAIKDLGVTTHRFNLLVNKLGGAGDGIINTNGQPITEHDKGRPAYVSPDFFESLKTARAELIKAGEGWLNRTELCQHVGCGEGRLSELLEECQPKEGEYDDESITRNRGFKVRHFSQDYADRLQLYHESHRQREPRERYALQKTRKYYRPEKFISLPPHETAKHLQKIHEVLKVLDEKIKKNYPEADQEEVREVKNQALETKIQLERLLNALNAGETTADFIQKLETVLEGVPYDLEMLDEL